MTAPRFAGSEIYRHSSYGGWHPLRVPRVSTVMDLVAAMGWLGPGQYVDSPRAEPDELTVWHDPDYLDALRAAERAGTVDDDTRARFNIGTPSNPVFAEVFSRPATGAGAVRMAAADLARRPGIWHVPGGGTHHGMPDHANGFCYLNDPVLAVLALRAGGLRRIAYVDIDAHHPDGVEHAFAADPEVLMISVHQENRWPRTGALTDEGAGAVFNLPVPRGFHDAEMAAVRDRLILPAVAQFRPQAIVLQCGADAVAEDPQSQMMLSNAAHWRIVRDLRAMTDRYLVLGGGGYNPWSVGRLWAGVWAVLNDAPVPARLPASAETVLRALAWPGHRLGRNPPEHWFTTLADPPQAPQAIRPELRERLDRLCARLSVWV